MGVEQRKSVVDHPETLLGGTAIKPPERHGWEAIQYLIYNKETGEVFTRTPKSWFLITLFYCIYYSCLAAFWYGMLTLFLSFLPPEAPKYILGDGIIGTNPGVAMRPSQPDVTIDSSMLYLKYNARNEEPSHDFETASNIDWAWRYRVFLDKYDNTTNTKICSGDDYNEDKEPACQFDLATLGDCNTFPYGFQVEGSMNQVEPCVLLKTNRIYGWKPEPFSDEDLENDDPEDPIPEHVKSLIKRNRNKLYLDCQGENPADREGLKDKIEYFPSDQAMSMRYFPYTQSNDNYHSPLVAVKFKDLPRGQLFHIECKLWAKGVIHSSKHRQGQVHFEVILEQ